MIVFYLLNVSKILGLNFESIAWHQSYYNPNHVKRCQEDTGFDLKKSFLRLIDII